jgi:signal peptidase I
MSWEVAKMIDKQKIWKEIRSWIIAIGIILFLRGFIVQTFNVPTGSMKDTILIGDFLIVNRLKYGIKLPFTDKYLFRVKEPKQGEIIVFRYPLGGDGIFNNTNFVKRCVAEAGDTVYIEHKILFINGEDINADYISHRDTKEYPPLNIENELFQNLWEKRKLQNYPHVRDNFGPIVVPEGYVFAMGDNRDESDDSRFWGPVPLDNISGTPLLIYWSWKPEVPMTSFFRKVRWKRIGKVFTKETTT